MPCCQLNLLRPSDIYIYTIYYAIDLVPFILLCALTKTVKGFAIRVCICIVCDIFSCNVHLKLANIRKPQFKMQYLLTDFSLNLN